MSVQIEAGKYYRTRDGRKVGPMVLWDVEDTSPDPEAGRWSITVGWDRNPVWRDDGVSPYIGNDNDLVAEWSEGPVRTETVTKRRIVPGVYGRLEVGQVVNVPDCEKPDEPARVVIDVTIVGWGGLTATELDSLAMVASQLAEALRDA